MQLFIPMRVFANFIISIALQLSLAACVGTSVSSTPDQSSESAETRRGSGSSVLSKPGPPPNIGEPTSHVVYLMGEPMQGDPAAKIGVVVFTDYQCPYCRSLHVQEYPKLKKTYIDTGIVRYIYKDFPLKMHRHAFSAALAANCAGEQGQYWPMHDRLFASQTKLGAELYQQQARELKLDMEKFSACLNNRRHHREIQRDISEGRQLGVTGTPTVLLGKIEGDVMQVSRLAKGVPAFALFEQEIRKLQGIDR
jgi:protein-disulfide isomerase